MSLKRIVVTATLLATALFAEDKSIILQNGNNGYTGAFDGWANTLVPTKYWADKADSSRLFIRYMELKAGRV